MSVTLDNLNLYNNTAANAAANKTNKLEQTLNGDFSKEFEAYFVEQMFKAMMKTVPTDSSTSNYTSTIMDYYKDEMVQKLAKDSTETNGLGLAQTLYEQMKRNYNL